ncbi:hypothetical protein [Haloechinothrix salitolerans]|uniref:Uncharacterized protein n=1 Tax=Haloechinothrix salitolerans TaxID=926830 RepID=A0ABW2C8Q9_9PSEU
MKRNERHTVPAAPLGGPSDRLKSPDVHSSAFPCGGRLFDSVLAPFGDDGVVVAFGSDGDVVVALGEFVADVVSRAPTDGCSASPHPTSTAAVIATAQVPNRPERRARR